VCTQKCSNFNIFLHPFHFRIVRNKAAEKAKSCGSHSPSISQASGGGSGGNGGGNAASMGQQQLPMGGGGVVPVGVLGSDISALQRPSYSINGILGIPQADANANINKRKRDDDGKKTF
jgi:hypothetical protein